LQAQPSQVRDAIKEHEQSGRWPIYRTPGYVLYPYDEGPQPELVCAPLRTTDIQLQSGETITDVAMGDTERWMATRVIRRSAQSDAASPGEAAGAWHRDESHDLHNQAYLHMVLRSRGHAMQEVEFYYPDEVLAEIQDADAAATQTQSGRS
jgi:type IV secretion system protein VirB9